MSNLVKWDPFAELSALQKQFFNDDWMSPLKGINIPTTDVYTKDNELTVEAHLPNFEQEDINVKKRAENMENLEIPHSPSRLFLMHHSLSEQRSDLCFPLRMKHPVFINPLIRMRPKIIPQPLNKICRRISLRHPFKVK